MREGEAKEDAKLTDFQKELVLMAATLNGDHRKDIYPHKLVGNMIVSEGAKYVEDAFKIFCHECEKAKERGVDESTIIDIVNQPTTERPFKSFAQKILSCLACDN